MAEQKTYGGFIYARESSDQPWTLVGPASSAPQPMVIGTPNKVKVAKDQAELEGARLANQSKAATAPYDARKAAADALKAEADAAAAAAEGRDKPIVDPAIAQAVKNLGLGELLRMVASARREIGTGRATGVTGAFARLVPGSSANDFKGSLNSIQGGIIMEKLQQLKDASKTGASGMGALSEREGQRLADSVAALSLNQSDEKNLESLAAIERHAHALEAVAAGENPEDPKVARKYGIIVDRPAAGGTRDNVDPVAGSAPGGGSGGGGLPGALVPAGAKAKLVADPALAGVTGKIVSMIKAGRTGDEIRSYLEEVQPGLGGKVKNLDWWVRFHAANPGKPIRIEPPMIDQPLTGQSALDNTIAQSAPGAALMAAGDILSGGTLDQFTDNPALTRAGMAGVAAEHPIATPIGQVGGAVLAGMGTEGLSGLMGAGRGLGMVAGDVLPSALYGAGSADDGSRLAGGAMGGLAGVMGGIAGRTVGRGIAGVTDAGVRRLADAGVRMTPGQLAGGFAKRVEDRLSGLPAIGDLIRSQRRRGVEDFNRASFREALEPITQTGVAQIGEAGVGQAQQLVGQAYDSALSGQRVTLDPQFVMDMTAARNAAGAIPRVGDEVRDTIDTIIPDYFDAGPPPSLTGENLQPLLRELRGFRGGYRADPLGNRVAGSVADAEGAVTGMFERQAPDVMPALNSANEAYGNLATIQDAVLAAKNSGGVFMPSQLGTASVAGARRYGGLNAAARGDRALFDLQRAGQDVLPSQIPDSGTAGRMMIIPGALGVSGATIGAGASPEERVEGGAQGLGAGLALSAALASPYAARGLIQQIVARARPAWLQAAGEAIGRYRLPGALSVPLLVSPGG